MYIFELLFIDQHEYLERIWQTVLKVYMKPKSGRMKSLREKIQSLKIHFTTFILRKTFNMTDNYKILNARRQIQSCLEKNLIPHTVMLYLLRIGICSEKCVFRQFGCYMNISVHLHKPTR